jgi:GT2 family glycosyltransferase
MARLTFEAAYAGTRALDVNAMTAPCLISEIDVAAAIPDVLQDPALPSAQCAWILVRMHTEPIGILIMNVPPGGLQRDDLVLGLTEGLGDELRRHVEAAGATWPPDSPDGHLRTTRASRFLTSRKAVLAHPPEIAVVVCTRERPVGLERCLQSLTCQVYPNFSIVVVDNAPVSARSRYVVERVQASGTSQVKYVVEPRAGLSWARNRGFAETDAEIVACLDDDEIAEPLWLAELARGFYEQVNAGAVSGIMLPAELTTEAQIRFEQYGGFHKHRGFTQTTFSPSTASVQSPLFPLPPFGTGGNMAFRRDALRAVGGFDPGLGAGTFSLAAEDTRVFTELLLAGGTIVYQPSAVTRHFHRGGHAELRRQMLGYGAGLTAFYTSILLTRPSCAVDLIRLAPNFLHEAFGPASLRSGQLPDDFPTDLRWANRIGLAGGPVRYLVARAVARRKSHQDAQAAHRASNRVTDGQSQGGRH